MSIKGKFVIERALSREEEVRNAIEERNLPLNQFGWLATALIESGCITEETAVQPLITDLMYQPSIFWKKHQNHDAIVLLILESFFTAKIQPIDSEVVASQSISLVSQAVFVKQCSKRVDLTAALQAAADVSSSNASMVSYRARELVQMLREYELLQPEKLINFEELEKLGQLPLKHRGDGNSTEIEKLRSNIDSPYFWLEMGLEECESALSPHLEKADDNRAALLVWGLASCVLHARSFSRLKDVNDRNDLPDRIIRWAFDQLDKRVNANPRAIDDLLRRTWLRLWYLCLQWTQFPVEDDSARDEKLIAAAGYELGIFRQLVTTSKSNEGKAVFEERLETIEASASVMFNLCPVWKAMKPLILAFRELPVAGVAPDLRYWPASSKDDAFPSPWNRIMEIMINSFHYYARDEQQDDPDLENLRCDFCRFCLDRLKPNPQTGQLVESDAVWRWGYLRAAESLRCNPGSRSQNILMKVSKHDPDKEVRELARKVYTTFRHRPHLPKGLSPRRTLLSALFYIRQAHLISLNIDIDEPGANRTREEETRRTTQSEQM